MAKAAGFEGIEPSLTFDGPVSVDASDDDLKRLRDHAEQTVEIHGLMGGQPIRSAPLTTIDKDGISKGVENIAKASARRQDSRRHQPAGRAGHCECGRALRPCL